MHFKVEIMSRHTKKMIPPSDQVWPPLEGRGGGGRHCFFSSSQPWGPIWAYGVWLRCFKVDIMSKHTNKLIPPSDLVSPPPPHRLTALTDIPPSRSWGPHGLTPSQAWCTHRLDALPCLTHSHTWCPHWLTSLTTFFEYLPGFSDSPHPSLLNWKLTIIY